jgi:ATP-dependent helicase/nuclease subunit B
LQGSIDLVERHASGVLRVVDHKTGRVPDPRPEGCRPWRGIAADALRLGRGKDSRGTVAFGRLYYSTIAQNYATVDVPLNDWTRQRASQVLRTIDERHAQRLPAGRPAERWMQALRISAGLRAV